MLLCVAAGINLSVVNRIRAPRGLAGGVLASREYTQSLYRACGSCGVARNPHGDVLEPERPVLAVGIWRCCQFQTFWH